MNYRSYYGFTLNPLGIAKVSGKSNNFLYLSITGGYTRPLPPSPKMTKVFDEIEKFKRWAIELKCISPLTIFRRVALEVAVW